MNIVRNGFCLSQEETFPGNPQGKDPKVTMTSVHEAVGFWGLKHEFDKEPLNKPYERLYDTDGEGLDFLGKQYEKNATPRAGHAERHIISQSPIFFDGP